MSVLICLQILSLAAIFSIILFRKYLFSYSSEKGKNLATKEDIAEITQKVEEVKSTYIEELERLKVELSLLSKKHSILFDEKIRVFKKLQKRLVDFKKYCEASLGTHGNQGEFHPNLDVLDKSIYRSSLSHLTELHEIEQEDFIFLSDQSRKILSEINNDLSIMCSMELAMVGNEHDPMIMGSVPTVYESAMEKIDNCLFSLFKELEFPQDNPLKNIAPEGETLGTRKSKVRGHNQAEAPA